MKETYLSFVWACNRREIRFLLLVSNYLRLSPYQWAYLLICVLTFNVHLLNLFVFYDLCLMSIPFLLPVKSRLFYLIKQFWILFWLVSASISSDKSLPKSIVWTKVLAKLYFRNLLSEGYFVQYNAILSSENM